LATYIGAHISRTPVNPSVCRVHRSLSERKRSPSRWEIVSTPYISNGGERFSPQLLADTKGFQGGHLDAIQSLPESPM